MKIGSKYTGRILVEDLVDSPDANVLPGETYQTTCRRPSEPLHLSEILVRDFVLVELYLGNYFVETKERSSVVGSRAYQLKPAGAEVPAFADVRIILKNKTDRPLRIRQASFEEERRA